ncbi:MAG: hypothetical protein LBQ27_02150 [Clostridiales bacterium]|jgi:N-glycosylase/DNA lyase|nr:hypothetical protein [Clostridiales bacterium]
MVDYKREGNDIYIIKRDNTEGESDTRDKFDINKIILSGQIFRYFEQDDGYVVLSKDYKVVYKPQKNSEYIILSTNNPDYFIKYFDLNKNYDIINCRYADNAAVKAAIEYSDGIRLLNQDRFETVISFIISANNNIPRIKKIIERLCEAAGRKIDGMHAFPTAYEMRDLNADFYKKIGAGYRADYLEETIRAINDGFDLDAIEKMDTPSAHKYIMRLKGVGPKVADCILLFAYGKGDVFPVDTWIKKSAEKYFGITGGDTTRIRRELISLFGEDSGIIQQYIYYYMRDNKLTV